MKYVYHIYLNGLQDLIAAMELFYGPDLELSEYQLAGLGIASLI